MGGLNDFSELTIGRWRLRVRMPDGPPPHPAIFLLHGLAGDELVMGIFANQIPQNYLVLSPRGLFEADLGGYSWLRRTARTWPAAEDFIEPTGQVLALADSVAETLGRNMDRFHLMGFSQGAALAYTLAFLHPDRVDTLAGLAGFLPEGNEEHAATERLAGLRAFVSHGTQDSTVPVAYARQAVEALERAGAEVVYCEADVGHKLGAACFRALGKFYRGLNPVQ